MTLEQFYELIKKENPENIDYGICPPPLDAQVAFNALAAHFLGDDWTTPLPVNQEQVNTMQLYDIITKYINPKKRNPLTFIEFWRREIV